MQLTFPDELKLAQVTSVYKKGDPFLKQNYRPVSSLPSLSNLFDGDIKDQLSLFSRISSPRTCWVLERVTTVKVS